MSGIVAFPCMNPTPECYHRMSKEERATIACIRGYLKVAVTPQRQCIPRKVAPLQVTPAIQALVCSERSLPRCGPILPVEPIKSYVSIF
jgi:hypothetical protein